MQGDIRRLRRMEVGGPGSTLLVSPAKSRDPESQARCLVSWVPAFAGMTVLFWGRPTRRASCFSDHPQHICRVAFYVNATPLPAPQEGRARVAASARQTARRSL